MMVIERFKPGTIADIHERFYRRGRMLPPLVTYVSSWIDPHGERCFQLMDAPDVTTLEPWVSVWDDVIDFEITPVVPSASFWEARDAAGN